MSLTFEPGQRSRSQRDIMYQHKSAIIHAEKSCRRSNLVKIISEPSAIRYMAFKVIRSNIAIAITASRITRFYNSISFKYDTELSQAIHCKCSMSKVKGQCHSVK